MTAGGAAIASSAVPARQQDGDRRVAYDVVGMGNALVDIIAHVDDDFLGRFGIVKGSMNLIDTERAIELYAAMDAAVEMSGGSAANTMCGVRSFGGRAAYIGKVAGDPLGEVFDHDMRAVGVSFRSGDDPGVPTGRSMIVVTPDAQRTMNTYLGASSLLGPDDVDFDVVAAGAVLYMEGYLFDRDEAKAAFRAAGEVAHKHGRRVALTLSDSFCVDRHRDDFVDLVADQVDILFGNTDELLSLYQVEDLAAAIDRVRAECELAVITASAAGSYIVTSGDVISVPAEPVERVLDTTGAGDLYAAGFLFGLTHGLDLAECGRLGSIAAAEVISHVGPRPLVELRTLVA